MHGLGIRTRYISVYFKAKRQSGHLIETSAFVVNLIDGINSIDSIDNKWYSSIGLC